MCWRSHWLERSLSTSGRSLVFSRSRFPQKGSDESVSHSDEQVKCKGWAILSWWEDWLFPCQIWVLSHSNMTIGLVPTWSYIRAIAILWMEVPSQLPGKISLWMRAILIWLWDVFSHDQIWVHGHSDVIEGCVPTWSYIRAVSILGMELPGAVPWKLSFRTEGHSDMIMRCDLTLLDMSAWPF